MLAESGVLVTPPKCVFQIRRMPKLGPERETRHFDPAEAPRARCARATVSLRIWKALIAVLLFAVVGPQPSVRILEHLPPTRWRQEPLYEWKNLFAVVQRGQVAGIL